MKYKFAATIPVVQYGNLLPEIEVEAESFEEAEKIGMGHIQRIWDLYGEKPLVRKEETSNGFIEIQTFTGEKILWNELTHEYRSLDGKKLMSGSAYKKQFDKPFNTEMLSQKVGEKYKVDPTIVAEMWSGNSRISTTFGHALHYAMEQWFKYRDHACDDKQYNLPKHPFLRGVVESFPLKANAIVPEAVVSNVEHGMAGTIDGIDVLDWTQKVADVIDYKSDADIKKNLNGHFKQLSWYAQALRYAGWSIGRVRVCNYTDKWEMYDSEPLEIIKPS